MKSYAEKNEKNLYAFFVNCKAKRVPWRKNSLACKRKLNSLRHKIFPNFKIVFKWRCHDDQNSNSVAILQEIYANMIKKFNLM